MATGVVVAVLPSRSRTLSAVLAGAVALWGTVAVALRFGALTGGGVEVDRASWIPSLGLDLVLRLDGLAWVFSLMVYGIGALVVLYARYYLSAVDPMPRFYGFLLAFMGAMVGVVLSGNLVQLVFFWELTSIFSFLLIGYWHHRRDAQRGARMALLVTGAGGLCLLAGVLVLGHVVGSTDLDVVLASRAQLQAHSLYPVVLGLVLLGAFTKSAQVPFHFWLPQAMAAPTPVSAYLHSATMVKLGVFLLARLWPVLSGSELWFWVVTSVGLVTLLWGAAVALLQNDLKGLLAWSTISNLGLITVLLGLNSPLAAVAAVFHLINHAAFKASLFMAAGVVDHEAGTRDLRRLSGLRRQMPITAALATVACAAMAGVPLLNGFLSKEMFFAEAVFLDAHPFVEWTLPIAATLAGVSAVAYSLRFAVGVFWGPPADELPLEPHEPPKWMRLPIALLVVACVVVGVAPDAVIGRVLDEVARPVVGGTLPDFNLALWHGFNLPLLMSALALVGGVALFMAYRRHLQRHGALPRLPVTGATAFATTLAVIRRVGRVARARLTAVGLQRQLLALMVVVLLAGGAALSGAGPGTRPLLPLTVSFTLLWVVGSLAAVGAAWQAKFRRLTALMLMSVCGLVSCITFLWFSAPDLALTQLVVEVATLLLMLLGLRWLPPRYPELGLGRPPLSTRVRRARDLTVAVAVGTFIAGLSYALATRNPDASISPFFLTHALSGGGGRNVVNVMLVDFRGFDTFGEGVVLVVVALTVYALLRRFRPPSQMLQPPEQQRVLAGDLQTDLTHPRTVADPAVGYLTVPAVLVRLLLPVAFVVGASFFLRGHNAPGGGFMAGLVVSVALLLQYMVSGTEWVEAHIPLRPRRWAALGLLLVLATGVGSFVVGYPLLTTHTWHFSLPLLGEVHFPSATFFDLGVFFAVVGSTLLILVALAHQAVRAQRQSEAR